METKSLTVAIQVCISISKKCSHLLMISSLFFCLASRSLSCNSLNNETNGCEELDSICMVKKIGTYFGVSSKIRFSWIKEWNVAMGLLKIFVTYFNPKVSLLGQTWHFSPLILRFLGGVSSDLIWFAKIVAKYDCVSRNQNQTILINLVSKYLQSISLTYVNHYNPRFVYFYPLFENHFFVFKEVFSEKFVLVFG